MSSIEKTNPQFANWDKSMITQLEKHFSSWEKGFDLSNYSDTDRNDLSSEISSFIKNKMPSYNVSVISKLIENDLVLTDNHVLVFDEKEFLLKNISILDIKDLVFKSKTIKLNKSKILETDLLSYLNKLDTKIYEREFIFLVTSVFDDLIVKHELEKQVNVEFLNQIYATTTKPLDLVKFVFFTMSQHDVFKKDPLFKVLFNYLAEQNLDGLFVFLKNQKIT